MMGEARNVLLNFSPISISCSSYIFEGYSKRLQHLYFLLHSGAHYQECDCKVHPAISTVTKVSIFGSRFPAKSSYVIKSHIVIGQIQHPLFVTRKNVI